MAYRATPHRMMWKSPTELMFGYQIHTKLWSLPPKAQGKIHKEARQTREEQRAKKKAYADAKRDAKEKVIWVRTPAGPEENNHQTTMGC